jgi:hypothetical protein
MKKKQERDHYRKVKAKEERERERTIYISIYRSLPGMTGEPRTGYCLPPCSTGTEPVPKKWMISKM